MDNYKKRKQIVVGLLGVLALSASTLLLAFQQNASSTQKKSDEAKKYELVQSNKKYQMKDLQFHLDPETFQLTVQAQGKSFTFAGGEKEEVLNVKKIRILCHGHTLKREFL